MVCMQFLAHLCRPTHFSIRRMHCKKFRSVLICLLAAVLDCTANESPAFCLQGGSCRSKSYRPFHHSRKERVISQRAIETSIQSNEPESYPLSHIAKIRCQNFAGVTADGEGNLELLFGPDNDSFSNLVVVSGETGHGKSLLISKVVDLVTGGKASTSLLHNPSEGSSATVEIVLRLCSPDQVKKVRQSLDALAVDSSAILGERTDELPVCLSLKRSLRCAPSSGKERRRLQSTCYINEQSVPLRILKGLGAPLLPVVNAPLAASALAQSSSRLSMIDSGVRAELLTRVHELTNCYNQRKKEREMLEQELESRTLPISMTGDGGDKDLELLQHWIDELSGFENRILDLVASLTVRFPDGTSQLGRVLDELVGLEWTANDSLDHGFSSSLYRCLLELSEELKSMDHRIEAAHQARDSLASLSSSASARTALDRARQFLLDVNAETSSSPSSRGKITEATEKAHDLLNEIERALNECDSFLDDEDKGLMAILQNERDSCSVSSERLWDYLLEWNTLARKHGISPYLLPSCHISLREELDGNVEARELLPSALTAEHKALNELQDACEVLSEARRNVASRLSESVTGRLPSLGMDSNFSIYVHKIEHHKYGTGLGVDEVDFFLYHDNIEDVETTTASSSKRGGKVDLVASAGEKARILLAIECQVPGSIRALCGIASSFPDTVQCPPVAVIYDEIDAHVGGRASASVARILSEQSRCCQVIAITHSASVAATADLHICVQKQGQSSDGISTILAQRVDGAERLQELARMASGDMAMEEARDFAEALIRDASMTRRNHASTSKSVR